MTGEKRENLITSPPVVVILGHVDHGKSSILEAIKDLKITAKESGGITQHIGAYEIEQDGKKITFIDTPGHEAFSAMRSRGAKVADIAVLVVAGDEGVKEQTKEAISHIKEAKIPMVVAINKIDKPEADPEKVKRELVKQEIQVESMGGKIPCVNVSAKTKQGINDLLDIILLLAEMEDLKADISKPATGFVIESYQDSKRGPTCTIILQEGILKKEEIIGTDSAIGKVKILEDFQGKVIEKVVPAQPAIVVGFEKIPGIGETFRVFTDMEEAKRNLKPAKIGKILEEPATENGKKILNLIIKADVHGSLEAIIEALKIIPQEKAGLKIIKAEVGEISEMDLKLAKGSGASIIGFRVNINSIAKNLANREKIKIKTFDIIYELSQAVRQALEKLVEPEIVREDLGKIKILAVFRQEKSRQIIGGKVTEGKIKKGAILEVYRNDEKVGEGKVIGLQRDKKEIDEVSKGTECGILYEGNVKIAEGDILQAYLEERRKVEL